MTNIDSGKLTPKGSAGSVADVAREQFQDAKDAAGTLSEEARQKASDFATSLKDKARDIAEEQKARGSDQIDGVADAIHGVADDLGKQMPAAAGYVREAAKGVEQFSTSLRNKSVDDLLDSAYHFARSQPLAFFGASVLAGFAISRFLKSSAERRDTAGRMSGNNQGHNPARREPEWSGLGGGGIGRPSSAPTASPSAGSPGMAPQRQGAMNPGGSGSL